MNLNKVFLIGRLAADPEVRTTQSGQQVVNFRIATNRVWKNQSGEKQEQVEFHTVVAWGKLADIINQYLKRGGLVMIEGRLQTRSWTGQDNVKRYRTEIVAEGLQMGPRAATTSQNSNWSPTPQTQQVTQQVHKEEEIPVINENEPIISDDEIEEKEVKVEDIPF